MSQSRPFFVAILPFNLSPFSGEMATERNGRNQPPYMSLSALSASKVRSLNVSLQINNEDTVQHTMMMPVTLFVYFEDTGHTSVLTLKMILFAYRYR